MAGKRKNSGEAPAPGQKSIACFFAAKSKPAAACNAKFSAKSPARKTAARTPQASPRRSPRSLTAKAGCVNALQIASIVWSV